MHNYDSPSDFFGEYEEKPAIYGCQLIHIKEHFQGVIDHLYGKDLLNTELLESSLEEIAGAFDMDLPKFTITVERQRPTIYCRHGYA